MPTGSDARHDQGGRGKLPGPLSRVPRVKRPSMLVEFRDFVMRGNLVDLAVAFVAGAAFTALVTGLVASIVNPVIGVVFALFGGTPDFSQYRLLVKGGEGFDHAGWTVFSTHAGDGSGGLLVGAFVNVLITFVGTMAGVFFLIVKPVGAMAARLALGDPAAEAVSPSPKPELLVALEQVRFVQDTDGAWRVAPRID